MLVVFFVAIGERVDTEQQGHSVSDKARKILKSLTCFVSDFARIFLTIHYGCQNTKNTNIYKQLFQEIFVP